MHVTSGFASDLIMAQKFLCGAHLGSPVLVSVYNRQLCKLIVGRPLIAVWKTYRGGITSHDTVAQRS